MREILKIDYISPVTIPSRSADSVQVMKACDSLQLAGALVALHTPFRRQHETNVYDVYDYYGCVSKFDIFWHRSTLFPERYNVLIIALKAAFSKSDIVLSRSIPAALITALLGKKVIMEIHEPFDRGRLLCLLSKWLLKMKTVKGIITNCEALRLKTLSSFPHFKERCIAIHNGSSTNKDCKALELNPGNGLNVGYAGQLFKGKGLEIIKALASLHPEIKFHVVGGMPDDIRYWKNEMATTNNVYFYGFVQPSEINDYIQGFDIVLAPYQHYVHGFNSYSNLVEWTSPMKVFDYMAAGKPIIASDLPFMHEILENDHTALLCPPDDLEAWSSALISLVSDKEKRISLGNSAKDVFLDKYTWEKRARKVIDFMLIVSDEK